MKMNIRSMMSIASAFAVVSLAFSPGSAGAQLSPQDPVANSTPAKPEGSLLTLDTNAPLPAISGPAAEILQFLSQGTNWMVATYGIYSPSASHGAYGAGLALGYKLSDFVVPTLRLDYLNHTLWMPSASLQLQAPLTLFGKVTTIPFAFGGIATPIAGKGKDNGTVAGIYGAGLAERLDFLGSWGKHVDLLQDVESWSGFQGLQYRFGIVYKF